MSASGPAFETPCASTAVGGPLRTTGEAAEGALQLGMPQRDDDQRDLEKNALPKSESLRDYRGAGLHEIQRDRDQADGWQLPRGREDKDMTERRLSSELREKEAACIKEVEGLKPENWRENSQQPEKNLVSLNQLEQKLAEVHGREPVPVMMLPRDLTKELGENAPEGLLWEVNDRPAAIMVHPKHLEAKDSAIAVQTTLYEVQRVKQWQAENKPESRPEISASKLKEISESRRAEAVAQDTGTESYKDYINYANVKNSNEEAARIFVKSL